MKPLVELTIASAVATSIMSDGHAQIPSAGPTPGGRVAFASPEQKKFWYDEWHFAPARVEGSLVFVSGVLAGARDGKPLDVIRAVARLGATK
jgi:hypothetical protein